MTNYFSAATLEEAMDEDIREYPLPDSPDIIVRVKSVSSARMRQYQESLGKGGSIERRAQASLIADSVIDEHGKPAFNSGEHVYNIMGKVRSRRLSGLVRIISLHNGGEDKAEEAEEGSEKKSEAAV